jgi:hypothetical protein
VRPLPAPRPPPAVQPSLGSRAARWRPLRYALRWRARGGVTPWGCAPPAPGFEGVLMADKIEELVRKHL